MPQPTTYREPRWHRRADQATGALLFSLILFSTWAFGGWPTWSIWTMNVGGSLLGFLWLVRAGIRRRTGFVPTRWGNGQPAAVRYGLGAVTLLLLSWCLISAVNARATVDLDALRLVENPRHFPWLPHSCDQPATWFAFWQYLGLAGLFWALRDWITIASRAERRLQPPGGTPGAGDARPRLPHRLRRTMWVLSLNGGAVALVGIVSTIDNPTDLLWLLPIEVREGGFFGPFHYRNHGAAFVNLIWPLCLGLWLFHGLRAAGRGKVIASIGRSPVALLPLCLGLMIAAPFISSSRGGSVIAVLLLVASLPILLLSLRRHRTLLTMAGLTLMIGGGLGIWLARGPLTERFFREFFAYPTGLEKKLDQLTIRATVRVPASWEQQSATFAGLSDDSRLLWNTPGSLTLSLRRAGAFEARFVEADRNRVLTLAATHPLLAEAGRTVELIFTHRAGESTLHLNGEPLEMRATKSAGGFAWPERPASRFLWVGRGAGGSMEFNERIENVTLLDRSLTEPQVRVLANFGPQPSPLIGFDPPVDPWSELDPPPVLQIRPYTLSPTQWLAAGLGGRGELHALSREMMALYPPAYGAGPGTFARLFMVFRQNRDPGIDWYAHNDHLETRITFGLAGAALIYLALLICVAAPICRGGVNVPWYWLALVGLGLAGALVHARFDWVFQSHALLFLGVVLSSVISTTSIRLGSHLHI